MSTKINVQCDWLQVAYKCKSPLHLFHSPLIDLRAKDYGTKLFNTVYDVFFGSKVVATLAANPRVDFLGKDFCMLKLDNHLLYTDNWLLCLQQLESILELEFNNISRLDLCVDFNTFTNGADGEKIIRNFLKGGIRLLGKRKFHVIGKNLQQFRYDYLKFGNSTSDIVCYLYNKTLELSEVKMKPYIVESWKQKGIDTDKNVWRLEFSIKNSNKHLVSKLDGSILNFKDKEILQHDFLHQLFFILADKYFHFKHQTGQQNVSREKDVKLFDVVSDDFIFKGIYDKKNSGRFERIFASKLNDYNNEVRQRSKEDSDKVKEVLKSFIDSRGINVWAEKRLGVR